MKTAISDSAINYSKDRRIDMENCPICDTRGICLGEVSDHKHWQVHCPTCGMRGPRSLNMHEAKEQWNDLSLGFTNSIKEN